MRANMIIFTRIRIWWRGRWIDSTLESLFPSAGQAGSPDGHYDRPWLARTWLALPDYWNKHWQFTLNALTSIAAILVAAYVAIGKIGVSSLVYSASFAPFLHSSSLAQSWVGSVKSLAAIL